jgi:hypothetical protein
MIEDLQSLKDWFLMFKLRPEIMANTYAMEAWEKALSEPTKARIWVFYVMAGMDLFIKDQICWHKI